MLHAACRQAAGGGGDGSLLVPDDGPAGAVERGRAAGAAPPQLAATVGGLARDDGDSSRVAGTVSALIGLSIALFSASYWSGY